MRSPEYNTVVRSLCGDAQLRRVAEIKEWRVEQELGSDSVVLSVTTDLEGAHSFLVARLDALDLAEVLRRRTESTSALHDAAAITKTEAEPGPATPYP